VRDRHSRLLIPLPPNPKVREGINELYFKCYPNTVIKIPRFENNIFEGLSFEWLDWYGFRLKNKDFQAWRIFRSRIESVFERNGEEMLAIDWLDEDDWEYIELSNNKQYSEVFSERYENGTACVTLYDKFFRMTQGGYMEEVDYSHKNIVITEDTIPIFKKLCRRGLVNITLKS
jgi:hypothetical protein